tara:strand:- start:2212 stop:3450 length:1239 start_codon:yes stop_codon:yes gene_type:complete
MEKGIESKHNTYPSIYRKIKLSFGLMTLVMFGAFWTVIYLAENQMEVISLHHWLDTEATRYVTDYKNYGDRTVLPNPAEFSTYFSSQSVPGWLSHYVKPGFYEYLLGAEDKHFIVLNNPSGDGLMYIVFQDDADDYLDEYEWTLHNYTLLLGGLISILVVFYAVYVVRSLSKPLSSIERKIGQMTPGAPTFDIESAYAETRHIEQTLVDAKNTISGYFQREKEFSRFASHELRTPIMVISGSAELLAKVPNHPPVAYKAIARVQQATEQMRVLTEAFLLLGKETIEETHFVDNELCNALQQQLDEMAPLFTKQGLSYQLTVQGSFSVHAPESFVLIVMNNLIKNAFSYSIDDIALDLSKSRLTISNHHDGNETYNAGYGCGLVIVERICERMGWRFDTLDDGRQFIAHVRFS